MLAADGKAQVGASGVKGVSSYTPEWKHHNPEEMVNPNFPVDIGRYVDFAMRSIFYKKIDEFRQEQNKVFTVAMKKIKQDKKLTQEQKTKKVQQDFNRIMIQAVREKAKELKTGCVHFAPFEIAEDTSPCPLHMDTNEFVRVLEHLILQSARLTHRYFCDDQSTFVKFCGRDKRNGQVVPNVHAVSVQASLRRVLSLLREIHLSKIADYFSNNIPLQLATMHIQI